MRILVWIVALTLPVPVAALETLEEIRACVRQNFPTHSSFQTLTLAARDRGGHERTLEARLYWRRAQGRFARIMMRVDHPADLRGASYLLIENDEHDDMFMYLPALQKVRRISGGMLSGQLWGTDFSYEDIKQLQGIAVEGLRERLPDGEIAGRSTYVLLLVPAGHESTYERIVSHVDQRTCVPLQIEFYEREGRIRKRLVSTPDEIRRVDGRWIAHALEMVDLRDGTRTWLRIEKVVNDGKLRDRNFDPAKFYLGR